MILFKYINDSFEYVYLIQSTNISPNIYDLCGTSDTQSHLKPTDNTYIALVGPKLNFKTPWATNAQEIIPGVRIEQLKNVRCSLGTYPDYDPLLEQIYHKYPLSLDNTSRPEPTRTTDDFSSFDTQDAQYYSSLFRDKYQRNPTDVELFDILQSNCEHSRHNFFNGQMIIDKKPMDKTLFQLVKETNTNPHSLVAFSDDSSAIKGYNIQLMYPNQKNKYTGTKRTYHPILTAETHNFPTSICPFPGAATGTGGRIRDVHAMGRGAFPIAGTAGYCVGDIKNVAHRRILIEASNGASFYGNNFGEPVIAGFTRSCRIVVPYKQPEPREWVKCIMFSGGIGQVDDNNLRAQDIKEDQLIVKLGGPAYRIGMGGGSVSSVGLQNDMNAVQRADPSMEQKVNRVIRTCAELNHNPIVNIHDQGAGGSGNVIKELIYPLGGKVELDRFISGDDSLSAKELWSAEYQEQDALLINPEDLELFFSICERENAPASVVGTVENSEKIICTNKGEKVVDLVLDDVFVKFQKTFTDTTRNPILTTFKPTPDFLPALRAVLGHLDVCSKHFLTVKVDRSVTGLIAQQQCVGPFHTPICDYALCAQSYHDITGIATAIGEQPIKGLIDPEKMARLSVAEMLTNLMWVKISDMRHISTSCNWMWPAKLPGENANIYRACVALNKVMLELGISIDGGKDSLSMYTKDIKSPGSLVVSGYVTVPDITRKVTPDLKTVGSTIIYINLSKRWRLGGSVLARTVGQLGDSCPDLDEPKRLKELFQMVQDKMDFVLSGHDISDGGMITTVLEMAFAGNIGIHLEMNAPVNYMDYMFAEEVGVIIETMNPEEFSGLEPVVVGHTIEEKRVIIDYYTTRLLNEELDTVRKMWETTGVELDKEQANPACVIKEFNRKKTNPQYKLTYSTTKPVYNFLYKPKMAIIRAEGSNGDREMAAAFFNAGFDVYDVMMTDLLSNKTSIMDYVGAAFVGGFSYMDVFGAGKGWNHVIQTHLKDQFDAFYGASDRFSLGICNGAQLMYLMGWVGFKGVKEERIDFPYPKSRKEIRPNSSMFEKNISGRFESRWSSVKIMSSPAIMLKDMEGSILGVWTAHSEGLIHVNEDNLCPIRYVDEKGDITEEYPANPNGSSRGITGICSPCGRHLAMMPHPERCFIDWQVPYGKEVQKDGWMKLFYNAYNWCVKQKGIID